MSTIVFPDVESIFESVKTIPYLDRCQMGYKRILLEELTPLVSLVEQQLLTWHFRERSHEFTPGFSEVRVSQSLVFFV